ncbi:MAG TPA: ribulose-phosphate 3-epimerase [Spirochaetia bacterium]|nr:ribulose-phosphate 3-epimerase [Spirochaetia bacterium]
MDPLKNYLVAPSLLSADFAHIGKAIRLIEESGGDWVHLDVMDGCFVPNITFGPKMVSDIRPLTKLPLDVHLMIEHPDRIIPEFAKAGADHITFHVENTIHVHRIISQIREFGAKAGVSIVPSTPVAAISELLAFVDVILVMTVNPGFGGQELIPECLEKVRLLDQLRRERGYAYVISVDGGVNRGTAEAVREAGTDVLISGSSFFAAEDPALEVMLFKGQKIV